VEVKLINTQFRFSFYKNLFSVKKPEGEYDINNLIELIQYGYLKAEIEKLRKSKYEKYDDLKKQLPAVTISGTFKERNYDGLIQHTGLIQIDIDNITNYNKVFKMICADVYTYVCFRSPGGKGIKVVVKINPSVKTHLEQFYALEKYYSESFKITIDPLCKDVSRCMLLSYDPKLYCNPFSDVFEELYTPPRKEKKTESPKINYKTPISANNKEQQLIESLINEIKARKIDITEQYDNWIKIGFALSHSFGDGGRGYFHRISEIYPSYKYQEADKFYTGLLKKNNGTIKIGTLLFIAKGYGVSIITESKK
jgi:hypothetical protein